MNNFTYNFPAVKGYQAKDAYYICMVPLGILFKLFPLDVANAEPEYRAQRRLNMSRIPEIRDYILSNRDSYVFSALCASFDGNYSFKPADGFDDLGILSISLDAVFLINDGQHRRAAIVEALNEDPSLSSETIPVVMFLDKGLARSQQMFTDLNKHAVTTSKSLNALYDSKDQSSIITKQVLKNVDFLNKYTDKEKDNLGKFSQMLFTLNNFVNANKKVVKSFEVASLNNEETINYLSKYWNLVVQNINEWCDLERRDITKKELRENYIITQGITILALGLLADFFFNHKEYKMENYLPNLKKIDWSRNNNKCWLGCAIKQNRRINRTDSGINLTFLRIKSLINLPMTESEKIALERSKQ